MPDTGRARNVAVHTGSGTGEGCNWNRAAWTSTRSGRRTDRSLAEGGRLATAPVLTCLARSGRGVSSCGGDG
jgi:hypothetical protein